MVEKGRVEEGLKLVYSLLGSIRSFVKNVMRWCYWGDDDSDVLG